MPIREKGGRTRLSRLALHITAPAIYNYFARRDDLVTALIVDAYTSFGDSQLAARDAAPAANPSGRLMAIGAA
jgi:hypothetical protein